MTDTTSVCERHKELAASSGLRSPVQERGSRQSRRVSLKAGMLLMVLLLVLGLRLSMHQTHVDWYDCCFSAGDFWLCLACSLLGLRFGSILGKRMAGFLAVAPFMAALHCWRFRRAVREG